jgi:hypothetical protein
MMSTRTRRVFKFNAVRVAVDKGAAREGLHHPRLCRCSIDAIHLARTNGFGISCNEWPPGRLCGKDHERLLAFDG